MRRESDRLNNRTRRCTSSESIIHRMPDEEDHHSHVNYGGCYTLSYPPLRPASTPATVNQAFDRNNRVSPREAIMDPQISLQEVVRYEAGSSERPSGILVSFKSHKHRLQQSPAVSQAILVIFTSGLFACVVGVASLIEPARISDHLSFRIFYPSGTILMLSILLLKFPPNLIPASVAWIKFVLQLSLMLAPVLMMTFVRLIFYGDPILTVLAAGAVFSGQLVVSFTYVLLCMRDMRY